MKSVTCSMYSRVFFEYSNSIELSLAPRRAGARQRVYVKTRSLAMPYNPASWPSARRSSRNGSARCARRTASRSPRSSDTWRGGSAASPAPSSSASSRAASPTRPTCLRPAAGRTSSDASPPASSYHRQIHRWTTQYRASQTEPIPEMERLIEWLPAHVPAGDDTTLVHGDYRPGNIVVHPTEPRILAVLDWELSTLGHPLADLAYACVPYYLDADGLGG